MLYVFFVNTGTMLTFDMNLAMESVSSLQAAVLRACHIPEDKQVLLISGGENLHPNARVCSYSAGTDTNPIFLFSKSSIEAVNPPSPSVDYGSEQDLRDKVEGSLSLPSTYDTVVVRAQLSLQMHEVAGEIMKACEHLVHDQHLQHQGWAAVIANLEDITSAFKTRSEIFLQSFEEYNSTRQSFEGILSSFQETLDLLGKIPLLPCLLLSKSGDTQAPSSDGRTTLLDWISAQDSRSSLELMVEQCQAGLQQFDQQVQETLKTELTEVLEKVNNPSMKEVKGLEDRLFGLEQLMFGARKIVQEQADMAQGFVQNQNRASNLCDATVLPDLCNSHKKQLMVLLKNHQSLRDIKRRCTLAKEELSVNLHTRLRWVMYVEKQICDVDGKLVIYRENLKKLRRKLEIIQQIHEAPHVYASAVVEAVRRHQFSQQFLKWAGSFSDDCQFIHNEEITKREQFSSFLNRHFLQTLFQGFEDMPPPFATDGPAAFDQNLPPISAQDVEQLRTQVPELKAKLRVPEVNLASHISMRTTSEASSVMVTLAAISKAPLTSAGSEPVDITVASACADSAKADIESAQSSQGASSSQPTKDTMDIPDLDLSQSVEVLSTEDVEPLQLQMAAPEAHEAVRRTVPTPEPPGLSRGQIGVKRTPETSPDMEETSDGFTTADFYIDESMPSSVTESPPHKKLIELQQLLQEKTSQLDAMDKEKEAVKGQLKTLKSQLKEVEDSCKQLYAVANQFIPNCRRDIHDLHNQVVKDKEALVSHTAKVRQQISCVLNTFQQQQDEERTNMLAKMNESHKSAIKTLQQKLDVESGKLEDAQQQVDMYHVQLREAEDACLQAKQDAENKAAQLKEELQTSVKQVSSQLMLEHEVELEKTRSDYSQQLEQYEQQLQQLKEMLNSSEDQLSELTREKELLEEKLQQQFQEEKNLLVQTLQQEHLEKMQSKETELRESLTEKHKAELENLNSSKKLEIENACKDVRHTCEREYCEKLNLQTQEWATAQEKTVSDLKSQFEQEKVQVITDLQQEIAQSYNDEIAQLKLRHDQEMQELKSANLTLEQKQMAAISPDDHQVALHTLRTQLENEKEQAVTKAVGEASAQHDSEMKELVSRLERDKMDSLNNMKSSITAEKQVMFNEAVSKVTGEKDKIIEELRKREIDLQTERQKDKDMIQKLLEVEGGSKETHSHLAEELSKARLKINELQLQVQEKQQAEMVASVVPVPEGPSSLPVEGSLVMTEKMAHLQLLLKTKEEENSRLQDKMMALSMTASTQITAQDKVSITTCNPGDIVLLCLDERHEQYVVFSVGATLHFLHSDCMEPLGLKTGPGETRKSWVLAEVTDKEYCQAKKAQNRFKVPVGTRFYRVKAKPWSRDVQQVTGRPAAKPAESAAASSSTNPQVSQ